VKGEWLNPDLGKITVGEWAWTWFGTTTDLRESGRERNRSYLRTHIIPAFGHRAIGSIDRLRSRRGSGNSTLGGNRPPYGSLMASFRG
jgi:hypothetical protein